jgi:hypothetical protein
MFVDLIFYSFYMRGSGSSGGIATDYGLDGPGIAASLDEAPTPFKRRVYDTLHKMELATGRTMEMRVVQKSPNTDWDRVLRNLHVSCVSDAVQSAWYLVI